ncbi:hypothetical protein [Methylosoma difficile]
MDKLIIFLTLLFSFIIFIRISVFLRNTYFFWCIFSFYNFSLLGPLAIPPIFLVAPVYKDFLPFLLPPLTFTLITTAIVASCILLAFPRLRKFWLVNTWSPFLVNFFVLGVFLFAAEQHKNTLITHALINHKPDCVDINPFFISLGHGGQEHQLTVHALFKEKGKIYFWSYSKLNFFEGSEDTNQSSHCHKK